MHIGVLDDSVVRAPAPFIPSTAVEIDKTLRAVVDRRRAIAQRPARRLLDATNVPRAKKPEGRGLS